MKLTYAEYEMVMRGLVEMTRKDLNDEEYRVTVEVLKKVQKTQRQIMKLAKEKASRDFPL